MIATGMDQDKLGKLRIDIFWDIWIKVMKSRQPMVSDMPVAEHQSSVNYRSQGWHKEGGKMKASINLGDIMSMESGKQKGYSIVEGLKGQ